MLCLFEIQQRFQVTIERTKDIAEYTNGFLQKLLEESKSLENYAVQADENQMKSIADFQKAYEVWCTFLWSGRHYIAGLTSLVYPVQDQTKSDTEKLIADVTSLVSSHMRRQKELVCPCFLLFLYSVLISINMAEERLMVKIQVEARLVDFRENAVSSKLFLDGHASSVEGITTDAKRKWQAFAMQADNDAKDGADHSSAKHCRMELLLQEW